MLFVKDSEFNTLEYIDAINIFYTSIEEIY